MVGRYKKKPLKKKLQKISRVDIINQVPEAQPVIKKTRLQRLNEWCDLNPTNCQLLVAAGGIATTGGLIYGDNKLTKKSRFYRNVVKRPFLQVTPISTYGSWSRAHARKKWYDQLDREQEELNRPAFGKRRKISKNKKIPKSVIKMCRRLKIRVCIKRGGKRHYKTLRRIKKEIKNKIKSKK
jgi:hypothetical protein